MAGNKLFIDRSGFSQQDKGGWYHGNYREKRIMQYMYTRQELRSSQAVSGMAL